MSGIYIHIPFCRRKCHYCNFFSLASLKYKERFLRALNDEIFIRKSYLNPATVESIYLGGGTPSLLQIPEIEDILATLRKNFTLSQNCEITLEANPDDLDIAILRGYSSIGINRLSIGVQSFFNDDLEYLNRIHSGERAEEAVMQAKEADRKSVV